MAQRSDGGGPEPSTGDGAAMRLREAAMRLFAERGYDRVTAAEIARAAGLTERTFFRYFADKREVLFDRQEIVTRTLTTALAEAPTVLQPLPALRVAFRAFDGMLVSNRSYAEPRERLIAATPTLLEREIAKLAELASELAIVLARRGSDRLVAELAATMGVAAFAHASRGWLDDASVPYLRRLDEAFDVLGGLAATSRDRSGGGRADRDDAAASRSEAEQIRPKGPA